MGSPDASLSVSVVVTSFNGEGYLPGMMAALDATGWPFLDVIVSDDASTDGSLVMIRHRYPHVRIVSAEANRGPSAARNAGIRAARGDLVLLLDSDGYPEPDAVGPLVQAFLDDPELAGAMPRIVLDGDPRLVHCDGATTHVSGQMALVTGHVPLSEAPIEPGPIASLMGTAMIFRRTAALAIGGFEPAFFFYYEDHDFGTRLRIEQGPLRAVPAARFRHLGGTRNLSFRHGQDYPARRQYLIPRNRWLFMLRDLEGTSLVALAPAILLFEGVQAIYVLFRGWIEPWFQALAWEFAHLGRTLRARAGIQSRRVVRDASILTDGPLPFHPGFAAGRAPRRGLLALLDRWIRTLARPGLAHLRRRAGQRADQGPS